VALSGSLAAQYQGSADVNLGRGIVIAGLASVMIGELIFRSNRIGILTLRVLIGSILFRGLMLLARRAVFIQLRPSDLQLIYGLFIIALLLYTRIRENRRRRRAAAMAESGDGPGSASGLEESSGGKK
jgi:putative ABC transport system permease protein